MRRKDLQRGGAKLVGRNKNTVMMRGMIPSWKGRGGAKGEGMLGVGAGEVGGAQARREVGVGVGVEASGCPLRHQTPTPSTNGLCTQVSFLAQGFGFLLSHSLKGLKGKTMIDKQIGGITCGIVFESKLECYRIVHDLTGVYSTLHVDKKPTRLRVTKGRFWAGRRPSGETRTR